MVMELQGMKAISGHVCRSDATVLAWIRDYDFPAKKIGGIWESTTEAIAKWKEKIFNGEIVLGNVGQRATSQKKHKKAKKSA